MIWNCDQKDSIITMFHMGMLILQYFIYISLTQWVPNIPFICCGHRFPPTESAEEQYVRSIHDFVEMNGITDLPTVAVSSLPKYKEKQSIPSISMESIEDDHQKGDTIIVTSIVDVAASKEG